MKTILTQDELLERLLVLKDTLQNFDFSILHNTIFINSSSFYSYLSNLTCGGERNLTLGELLQEIECCIPFALTDNSFEIFITAANETTEEKMEALRKGFIEGCKMDFLYLILDADSTEKWQNIVQMCEKLRKQRNAEKKEVCTLS